jgi:hypothetical protein
LKKIKIIFLFSFFSLAALYGYSQDTIPDPSLVDTVNFQNILNKEIGLKIFPNPTSKNATLQIHLRAPQYLRVNLADINNNLIRTVTEKMFNGENQSVYVETNGLERGSYIVRVESESGEVLASMVLYVER